MLDVYFSPDINLSELKKDENVTITENEITINCYGGTHSAKIGESFNRKDEIFHLYGWDMGVYYYLYEKYGYVFGQDVFEGFFVYGIHPDLTVDGPIFRYMCLDEMKIRLLEILRGREDELLDKIDADMEKLKPDFIKRVKELRIAKDLPDRLWGLVCTDDEIAEYKKEHEEFLKKFEEKMQKKIEESRKNYDDGLPF